MPAFYKMLYKTTAKQICLLCLWLCVFSKLSGQVIGDKNMEPAYHQYSTEDGLVSNTIYRICQDSKGYIWLATDAGISRFDGTRFRNYTGGELGYNDFLSIFCDSKDRIWIGGFDKSVRYYDRSKDKFIQLTNIPESITKSRFSNFPEFEERKDGSVIFRFYQKELSVRYTKEGIIEKYEGYYQDFPIDSLDKISLNTPVYLDSAEVRAFLLKYKYSIPDYFTGLYKMPSGFLLGQHLIVRANWEYHYYPVRGGHWTTQGKDLKAMFSTYFSKRAVGSFYVIPSDGGIYYHYNNAENQEAQIAYMPRTSFRSVFEDKDGNIWFGSMSDGLFLVYPNTQIYKNNTVETENKKYEKIAGFADKKLWIGLSKGHIIEHYENGTKIHLPAQGNTSRIRKLVADSKGTLHIVADSYLQFGSEFMTNCPKSLDVLKEDSLYLITTCIACVIKKKGQEIGDAQKIYLKRSTAACTNPYHKDKFWIGTPGQLLLLDTLTKLPSEVLDAGIMCMVRDKKRIWGGTSDAKILLLINDTVRVIQFSQNKAVMTESQVFSGQKLKLKSDNKGRFSEENINSIFIDETRAAWVCTKGGLYKLIWDGKNIDSKFYSTATGLLSNEIQDVYVFQQKVYAVTGKGISIFSENEIRENEPKTIITRINDILEPSDNVLYTFPYGKSLNIDFVGITFTSNGTKGKIKYVCELEGIKRDTLSSNNRIYDNLFPGDYTLKVYTMLEGQIICTNPAVIKLRIISPFWMKWWFYLLSVAVFCGFVFFIYKREKQKYLRKAQIAHRLAELELKAIRLQMNPHFIFNSLNSIQLYIAKGDLEKAQLYMSDFSALIRMTLNLSKHDFISLAEEIEYLGTYIRLEEMRFDNSVKFSIQTDPQLDRDSVELPPLLIQPYIENAIKHGIRSLQNKDGSVEILFQKRNDSFCCIVRDNGIGIKASLARKNFKNKDTHQSIGMQLGVERAALLQNMYPNYIEITVEDLSETSDKQGTQVTLIFSDKALPF